MNDKSMVLEVAGDDDVVTQDVWILCVLLKGNNLWWVLHTKHISLPEEAKNPTQTTLWKSWKPLLQEYLLYVRSMLGHVKYAAKISLFFIAKIAQENILPIFFLQKLSDCPTKRGHFAERLLRKWFITSRPDRMSFTYKGHRKPLEGNLIEPQIDFELMKNAAFDRFTSTYTLSRHSWCRCSGKTISRCRLTHLGFVLSVCSRSSAEQSTNGGKKVCRTHKTAISCHF